MQVRHRFAGVRAVIDYEAEAILRQAQFPGNFGGFQQQMTELGLVFGLCFGDPRNGFLRDQEDMRGRLRGDVVESDDQVVLINNPGRDFTGDDFLKQGLAHKLVSRAAQNRADSTANAWLLNPQRTGVPCGFSPQVQADHNLGLWKSELCDARILDDADGRGFQRKPIQLRNS